jgi:hypothetical protein
VFGVGVTEVKLLQAIGLVHSWRKLIEIAAPPTSR